ncbi:hypothetical protein [uncultured Gemella sp.]|uniref:hypothetical protein n=1 Tax=uncultured Gemella sp. TaxID=254352 RepID=UPI0028D1F7E2|nr:hypothetical protein [uncultured Gemella sp.]
MNNQQYFGYPNGQNPQYNNMVNSQFGVQGNNGQNPQYNNMNNSQFGMHGNNGQNPQYNNMNNSQFRGQNFNGQNSQFENINKPLFNHQNGYNNPNQFNPQYRNHNPNFNSMNSGTRMNSKTVGYITAAVVALVVVLIIIFASGSGKLGGSTPEEAVRNVIDGAKASDYKKIVNNTYFENDEQRSIALEKINRNEGDSKSGIELSKPFMDMVEIGETKRVNENRARVEIKAKGNELLKKIGGDTTKSIYLKKSNNRWFVEDNSF